MKITITDQTVLRLSYQLVDDITSFEGGSSINFELTFIDSNAAESTLEIETERWVHHCCLEMRTKPGLHINLKQNYTSYPTVTAYLRLRKPLSYINLNQTATLTMRNVMKTNTLFIQLSQASHAQVKVEIISRLYVSMSGAAYLIMSGFVNGTANMNVDQEAKLDAQSCLINVVFIHVSGAGVAYVDAEQSINIKTSQAGQVYMKDSIKIENFFDFNRITRWFGFSNTAARTMDQSINYFFLLFFILYFFLF
jgi:hypothetical protein